MFISFFGKYPDNLDPYSAALGDQGDFTEEPERIEDIAGEANKLADTLRSEFIESTSLLEQYQLLCKAEEQIGGLGRASLRQHEQVTPDSGLSLFNTLQTIQSSTESTFLKRMALNNTMLWVHYMGRQWYKDGGLSQQAQALQAQHPDIKPLFDFGSHIYGRYDDFGDVEAMPPDMFFDTAQNEGQPVYSAEEDPDHELESILSIQTASVFGVHVHKLSLPARKRLFEFGLSLDDVDIKRISTVRESFDEMVRLQFAEAFLATEFGDDYGDAILDIAEHAERHQAMHIFETVNTLRVRTGEFAEMFKAIDPKFAHATEKAFNERITDALTALQEVAVKGHLHQDVAPHQKKADYVHDGRFDIAVHSIEEATEIIDGLEKTFGTMHKITTAEDLKITKVNSDETQFVMYRLAGQSAGNMLIYIRPEGAYGHDKQMEYGNRQGVEASISFMVDPLNPHKLLLPKDPDAVSIRFDHEGRLVDEAPNSERRDPTRRDGLISADLSSGMGSASSLAVKIGRFVAAGNRIRANRRGAEDSLHHNTNYFDQEKYGDADGFAHLARSVIRQIESMKKILRSKKIGMAAHVATKATGSEQVDLPKAA